MIAVEPLLENGKEMFLPEGLLRSASPCFELLGFDVLLDENMKPWLLEVNMSPSMNTDTPLDSEIKTNLLVDFFNLVGLQTESQGQRRTQPRPEQATGLIKQNFISRSSLSRGEAESLFGAKRDTRNKESQALLAAFLEEVNRRGAFQLVYPCENYHHYSQYFEKERALDKALND